MLRCWDGGSNVNFSNSFIFAGKIKSKSSKAELPWCLCTWREHQTATRATLHPTTGWTGQIQSQTTARPHSAGIKLWLWGELYRRTLSGVAEYPSLPAGRLNELQPAALLTCFMHLFQPIILIQIMYQMYYVEHIYQDTFTTPESLEGSSLWHFCWGEQELS